MGRRDVGRRRVGTAGIDPAVLRVADSVALRPTRDARSLREGDAAPRAISRRQTPGDFVRELGVDNKTTIPAPWTRGYGPPPAGVDGARYGVPRRTDGREEGRDENRQSRSGTAARPAPGYTPRASGSSSGNGEPAARPVPPTGAERRESRQGGSVFGFPPRQGQDDRAQTRRPQGSDAGFSRREGGSSTPAERGEGASRSRSRPDGGGEVSGGYRPRSGNQGSGGYRPRSDGAGNGSSSRPRGGESGGSTGGSRPRAEGGASRPSRGDTGSTGGGHAVSRPRRDRN
jgi:hypothetical protein